MELLNMYMIIFCIRSRMFILFKKKSCHFIVLKIIRIMIRSSIYFIFKIGIIYNFFILQGYKVQIGIY